MLALILGGCAGTPIPKTAATAPSNVDVGALVREIDLSPRSPQRVMPSDLTATSTGPQTIDQVYYGDGGPALASAQPKSGNQGNDDGGPTTTGAISPAANANPDGKGYELNFENTPIATVAKVVLGDILHVGYTIDARLQGTVTLASGQPVPRADVLFVLEDALRVANVALVREGKSYRLVPSTEAPGTGTINSARGLEPGYGITVIPLQFVSAATLTKLLDNFATKPGMVRADPSRNIIVIQGNAADRQAAVDTVHDFDADWMRGQSVGVFPVSNSTPEPIIAELQKIVDSGDGGLSESLVKLQPIARQNAILAVTRKPSLLKEIGTWVARLDKSGTAGTSVRVYHMRYGDARDVAELLNEIFAGNSDSGLDMPTNQLAPGSGAMTSSSGPSNFSGAQGTSSPQSGTIPASAEPKFWSSIRSTARSQLRLFKYSPGTNRIDEPNGGLQPWRSGQRRRVNSSRSSDRRRCEKQFIADILQHGKLPHYREYA